jgi:hypothetical protein
MQELAEEIEQLEGSLSEDKDNHETIAQLINKKKELEEMENA